jgi:hypothetical protein
VRFAVQGGCGGAVALPGSGLMGRWWRRLKIEVRVWGHLRICRAKEWAMQGRRSRRMEADVRKKRRQTACRGWCEEEKLAGHVRRAVEEGGRGGVTRSLIMRPVMQ